MAARPTLWCPSAVYALLPRVRFYGAEEFGTFHGAIISNTCVRRCLADQKGVRSWITRYLEVGGGFQNSSRSTARSLPMAAGRLPEVVHVNLGMLRLSHNRESGVI